MCKTVRTPNDAHESRCPTKATRHKNRHDMQINFLLNTMGVKQRCSETQTARKHARHCCSRSIFFVAWAKRPFCSYGSVALLKYLVNFWGWVGVRLWCRCHSISQAHAVLQWRRQPEDLSLGFPSRWRRPFFEGRHSERESAFNKSADPGTSTS